MKVLNIINRNMKLFLNSKLLCLAMIFGPLILVAIIGATIQDTSIKNIKAGVYVESGSQDFGDEFISKLQERSFIIQKENSLEECIQKVKDSEIQVCIEIIEEGEFMLVKLHVDFSKPRIVWGIIGTIQGAVEQESYQKRSQVISSMKEQTGEITLEMIQKENKIENAINEINKILEVLDNTETNYKLLQSDTQDAETQISDVIDTLNSLGKPELIPLIDELSTILGNLQTINQRFGSYSLVQPRSQLIDTREELEDILDDIREIRKDLEDLRNRDIEKVINPIELRYESISESQEIVGKVKGALGFLDYIFSSFLIFFMLFISIVFATFLRLRERKSNAYIRNIMSKTSGLDFVLGDFFTCLFMVLLQTGIILMVAYFFLNIDLLSNTPSLIGTLFIIASIFTLIGLAIGSLFNNQESGIIASVSICLLFFMFSSIITPVETLPPTIGGIVSLLPLTLLETKLRIILIFGASLQMSLIEIFSLIGTAIITSFLIFFAYKKNKENEI